MATEDTFRDWFQKCDADGKGTLTKVELYEGLKSLGCNSTKDEVMEMFMGTDTNKNGEITLEEFLNELYRKLPRGDRAKAALNAEWKKMDADGNGSLDILEVEKLFEKITGDDMTPEQAKSCMEGADINGDGKLQLEELNKLIE